MQDFTQQDVLYSENLPELDEYLQRGWQQNWHCAVWIDYEFGVPLQRISSAREGQLKLLWFANKCMVDASTWLQQNADILPAGVSCMQSNETEAQYQQHITQIHRAIEWGEPYQINHTLRLTGQAYGNPITLYQRLRQAVPYGALMCLPNQEWLLCFSPELFLRIHADGCVETEPMKGTAPRDSDPKQLQQDPKNRAENVMIVDLLRNDLGKLAQTGSVSVPEPFY